MIKKKLLFLALVAFVFTSIHAQDIPSRPEPARLVNDFAGMLQLNEVQALEQKLVAYSDSTSTQIVVVTVKELNDNPNLYASQLGQNWGVGQKGKNNGVVILVKPKTAESKGQVAIQNGYGMEVVVTDALSRRIIENEIIPNFKNGDIYLGIDAAVNAIILASKGQYKGERKSKNKQQGSGFAFLIIIGIIILFMVIASKKGRSRHHTMGSGTSSLPFWLLMGGMMGSSGKSSGSGWSDFSSGGGSFGGFGGGSFGGGGASGSW